MVLSQVVDEKAFWLVLVGFLWGATNPFIKKYSEDVDANKGALAQWGTLLFRWQYMLAFLMNQCGSVVFTLSLADTDVSMVVPVTNSLTFLFTALSGRILGEKTLNKSSIFGMVLVVLGVAICVDSKK